jgi:hypothetical protein
MTTLTFDRRGRICAALPNIVDQLEKRYRFRCGSYAPIGSDEWRPIEPADLIQFRLALETSGFASISRRRMRDAVRAIEARL